MTHYEYTIQGTKDGKKRNGDFVCLINKDVSKQLKNVKYILLKNSVNNMDLKLSARLHHNPDLDQNTIQIDQKIRCAIAVDKGDTIIFEPYEKSSELFLMTILKVIFGVQKNLVRVKKDSYNDMEINLCRLKKETMETIDVKDGDIVVIESEDGVKRIKQRVFSISETLEKEISNRSGKHLHYVDCNKHLNIDRLEENPFDIQPLFLDFDSRNQLGIKECEPVRVYRDVPNEIKNRLHLISTPLILTICTVLITLNAKKEVNLIILAIGILIIVVLNLLPIVLKK